MPTRILHIARKELLDTVRDRKALAQSLLVPLGIGILYAVLNPLLGSLIKAKSEKPITVSVQGLEHASEEFVEVLAGYQITLEPFDGDMEAAIRAGEQAAGLIIPPDFGDRVAREEATTLVLRTNRSAGGLFGAGFSVPRLELALNAYSRAVSVQRLEAREVDPGLLAPVTLDAEDLATPAQRAGVLAALMLPLLVGVVAVQGGMFIAIDVTAGEKERGTLEALLVTPASDAEVFLGKLAAVFAMTTAPVALTMFGFWASGSLLPESITRGAVLPLGVVAAAALVALPMALFLNVVMMITSVRTKTFKDAQSSVTPLVFAVVLVTMAAAYVPPREALVFLVPVYGSAAAVGALAVGGAMPASAVLYSVAGSLAAAGVGVAVALRLFDRERLLYRV